MQIDYNTLLYEKMQKEYNQFLEKLEEMVPQEVIEYAYEKVVKEDILCCIEYSKYPQVEAKALYSLKNPLHELYQEWLDTDVSYMDTLRGTINERAKSAVKETKEKQREIR